MSRQELKSKLMMRSLLSVLFTAFAICAIAQQRTITGRVTAAEDGSGLPGVNVVVKGTSNGTVTDVDGGYTLTVTGANTVLVFSFVGMETREVTVGTNNTVDVQLKLDVTQLSEVVVNAMGEVRPKDKLGIAPSTVRGDAVLSSGESGVLNGLSGKAPGLNIIRNGGDPGAGSYIQLRGQSTVTGDLQPLIVIDGMPMYNSYQDNGNQVDGVQQQSRLNDLNPDDIASIEVIKSASAAALWGSRAANGVIVITTKKGTNTNGKISINYTGTLSLDQVNKLPELQTTFGQGLDGVFGYNNARSWGDKISNRAGGEDVFIMPGDAGYAGYVEFPDGTRRYRISQRNSTETYDHAKDVFQTGHFLEHSISLSGGSDRSNFFASYSNLDQEGVIRNNSDYTRNTVRINASTFLTDKIQASANVAYSSVGSRRIQQGSNVGGIFLGGLRTPPDFDNSRYVGTFFDPSGVATPNKQITFRNTIGSGNPGFDNPFWTIENNRSFSGVNRIIGNVELSYDLLSWLNLKGNVGVDSYTDRRADFVNAQSAIALGGTYTEEYINETQWNTNLFATASNQFSDMFSGAIVLGFNFNNRQFNNVGATARNFIIPDAPPNLANSDPTNRSPFNLASTVRTAAAFTDISMDLADQVFINLTGRAESASTFGPEAQSLFFYPSASVAWQFTKMLGNPRVLNFGKLRASFGVVGRQPGPYLNLTQYEPTVFVESWGGTLEGSNYGVGGYSISTTSGNPLIKPERKQEVEGGVDLRFYDDRLLFSATAFYNKTTDAILPVNVSPSSGFANIVGNAASLENKGLEFSLEPVWVRADNGLTWSTNLIWSNYRNKVLSLSGAESVFLTGGGFTDGSSRAVEGQPIGVLWGTLYNTNEDGSYLLDENGFPTLAPKEGVIGNPNPDYRMSIGNTIRFMGFTLYALFDMQAGGEMWNGTRGALVNYGTAKSTETETNVSAAEAAQITTFDGETIATSGRATLNGDGSYTFRGTVGDFGGGPVALDQAWYINTGGGFNVNGPFVEKANWSRIREITLSYSFNTPAFRETTKLNAITIGVTGRNLFLWTPYTGIDPETNLTGANNGRGIDYFQNPNTRSLLFKLSITY